MLNTFSLTDGRFFQKEIESSQDLLGFQPVWVDLESPTAEEKKWIKEHYSLSIPDNVMDEDIEESARFYGDSDGDWHIRCDFLIADEEEPRTVRVAFILHRPKLSSPTEQNQPHEPEHDILFSIHDEDLPVFRLLRLRARRMLSLVNNAKEVLLKLFDADAEYSADALEDVYIELGKVSARVLASDLTDTTASEVLSAIARHEDLNGHIRRNMMDTRRAVSFLIRQRLLSMEQSDEARQILRDIDSLDSHTAFLFDKINFLMAATVGFININQNKIIKIFSVASVALLPPTLIASVYGMNFKFMPELNWQLGYPLALGLMIASALVPMLYFYKRGWLQ